MGDRANVKVIDGQSTVYLYTHYDEAVDKARALTDELSEYAVYGSVEEVEG